MYIVKKENVERIADTELKRDALLSEGFEVIEPIVGIDFNGEQINVDNNENDGDPIDIDKMTLTQLKEFAKLNEFDINGAKTKTEIIEKIISAKAKAPGGDEGAENDGDTDGEADEA